MSLNNTHTSFQSKIHLIGEVCGKAPEAVYALWRKYSASCDSADQSAILAEFVEWYRADLGGDAEALRAAVS